MTVQQQHRQSRPTVPHPQLDLTDIDPIHREAVKDHHLALPTPHPANPSPARRRPLHLRPRPRLACGLPQVQLPAGRTDIADRQVRALVTCPDGLEEVVVPLALSCCGYGGGTLDR
ncbi:hypothetical protein [Actinomadura decatromicini]|uniref:hypothetical protein n=1 Tax=Actinomadura decatromicini TaxID=2604572 RepID=UPI0016530425|nr:hypothetical protein [Actinomadura decatromicini]